MSRYIPTNSETRDFPAAVVVAYCFESKNGPAYVAYKGRQGKPARFFAFASPDRRDRHLSNYIDQQTEFVSGVNYLGRLTSIILAGFS